MCLVVASKIFTGVYLAPQPSSEDELVVHPIFELSKNATCPIQEINTAGDK